MSCRPLKSVQEFICPWLLSISEGRIMSPWYKGLKFKKTDSSVTKSGNWRPNFAVGASFVLLGCVLLVLFCTVLVLSCDVTTLCRIWLVLCHVVVVLFCVVSSCTRNVSCYLMLYSRCFVLLPVQFPTLGHNV